MSISHREIVCEAFIKEWPKFKLEGNKMLDVGCHDEALKNYFMYQKKEPVVHLSHFHY